MTTSRVLYDPLKRLCVAAGPMAGEAGPYSSGGGGGGSLLEQRAPPAVREERRQPVARQPPPPAEEDDDANDIDSDEASELAGPSAPPLARGISDWVPSGSHDRLVGSAQ